MDRFFARLVTVFAAICLLINLSACQMLAEDLPKNIMIDDTFSEAQEEAILEAIEEWNQVGREYLGYDIIIYQGRHSDEDGFSPMEDLNDGHNVIYYMNKLDKWYDYLYSVYIEGKYDDDSGASVLGYGLEKDILVFDFNITPLITEDDRGQSKYLHFLSFVTVHEFGHWIGIQHINSMNSDDTQPVMYPEGTPEYILASESPFLTKKDIQAFCIIYDCIKQP